MVETAIIGEKRRTDAFQGYSSIHTQGNTFSKKPQTLALGRWDSYLKGIRRIGAFSKRRTRASPPPAWVRFEVLHLPPLIYRSKKNLSRASIIPGSKTLQKLLFSLSSAAIDVDLDLEHFRRGENPASVLCVNVFFSVFSFMKNE